MYDEFWSLTVFSMPGRSLPLVSQWTKPCRESKQKDKKTPTFRASYA